MNYGKLAFWCLLAAVMALPIIGLAWYFSEDKMPVVHISIFSLVYFSAFCFLALAMGKVVVKSKDLNAMNKLFMVLVFLKLVTALGFFLIFMRIYEPEERWFVLPFIITYITFTAVEVISLKVLSK